jgi:hypothetical protein
MVMRVTPAGAFVPETLLLAAKMPPYGRRQMSELLADQVHRLRG